MNEETKRTLKRKLSELRVDNAVRRAWEHVNEEVVDLTEAERTTFGRRLADDVLQEIDEARPTRLVVDFAHEGRGCIRCGEGHEHWALQLLRFAARHKVAVTVLNEVGPGGGWPEVAVFGTREQLQAVANERAGDDAQLAEEIMEEVQ